MGLYVSYASDMIPNTIAVTLTHLILQFGPMHLMYNEQLTFQVVVEKLLNTIYLSILCMLLNMTVTYVA